MDTWFSLHGTHGQVKIREEVRRVTSLVVMFNLMMAAQAVKVRDVLGCTVSSSATT